MLLVAALLGASLASVESADESSGQYCAQCLERLSPEDKALLKPR